MWDTWDYHVISVFYYYHMISYFKLNTLFAFIFNLCIILGSWDYHVKSVFTTITCYDTQTLHFTSTRSTHVRHSTLRHGHLDQDTCIRPKTCKYFKILPSPTQGHVSMSDTSRLQPSPSNIGQLIKLHFMFWQAIRTQTILHHLKRS